MKKELTIALIGNPNCGKTTIFNALTGSKQTVGNWPGVTVERKSGRYQYQQQIVNVVDLPGTYYLNPCSDSLSLDEKIACDYVASNDADLIVNILDGANLERNLYLTLQLMELGRPVFIVINMHDILTQRGITVDVQALSRELGCPVMTLQASKSASAKELKQAIHDNAQHHQANNLRYNPHIEKAIADILVSYRGATRAQAISALEFPAEEGQQVPEKIAQVREALQSQAKQDVDVLFAEARYKVIMHIVKKVMHKTKHKQGTFTQLLDKFVLNRVLGLPIFLFVMYCMFFFAINVGGAFQDFFDISSDTLFIGGLAHLLNSMHAPGWLVAFIANGIGKGINTTITFMPVIGAMFLFLAFLQGSGYMTRAAFVVDRFMRAIGLPGKSFVPMIVGFGCNVPAIMGCRTLENKRDRILTVLMTPFMSCGARLAIFAVFTAAFFKNNGAIIVFALYIIGIVMAILTGLLLRKTLLQGKPSPFVMELPPYHFPKFKSLFRQASSRLKIFLFKAGKVIIPVCIVISALNAVNLHGQYVDKQHKDQSVLSVFGQAITPVFTPMGIHKENWPATIGLVTGTLAKEVVVGTLNTLYVDVGHLHKSSSQFSLKQGLLSAWQTIPANLGGLSDALENPILASEARVDPITQGVYGQMATRFVTPVAAFAYLLFILLYVPCVSTVAVMARELNRGWAIFSVVWTTAVAYGAATLFYQAMTLLQHPLSSLLWIVSILVIFLATIVIFKNLGKYNLLKAGKA